MMFMKKLLKHPKLQKQIFSWNKGELKLKFNPILTQL